MPLVAVLFGKLLKAIASCFIRFTRFVFIGKNNTLSELYCIFAGGEPVIPELFY